MARATVVKVMSDAVGSEAVVSDTAGTPSSESAPAGLRISDAASRAGVSPRTLRYYDELGILSPSQYTAGGERRYRDADLVQLQRILELREALGMNLEEIKEFLESEQRLDEVRTAYRANRDVNTEGARRQQRELLEEALRLNESLKEQLDAKLTRMDSFRATLAQNAERCRQLLADLG
jgi:MerR family transcriptional regulator, repressor of the yfmOP operon